MLRLRDTMLITLQSCLHSALLCYVTPPLMLLLADYAFADAAYTLFTPYAALYGDMLSP